MSSEGTYMWKGWRPLMIVACQAINKMSERGVGSDMTIYITSLILSANPSVTGIKGILNSF